MNNNKIDLKIIIIALIVLSSLFYFTYWVGNKEIEKNNARNKVVVENIKLVENYIDHNLYIFNIEINNKGDMKHRVSLNLSPLMILGGNIKLYDTIFNKEINKQNLLNTLDGKVPTGSYLLKKGKNNLILIYKGIKLKKPFMLKGDIKFFITRVPLFTSINKKDLKEYIKIKKMFE